MEVVLLHARILNQLEDERRNDVSVSDLVFLNGVAELVEVESRHHEGRKAQENRVIKEICKSCPLSVLAHAIWGDELTVDVEEWQQG